MRTTFFTVKAMGSIHAYENTKGEKLYRIAFRDSSNKQSSRRGFTTQKLAKAALAKLENSVNEGTYVRHTKGMKPLSEFATPWLRTKNATLKPSSFAAIDASWRTHVEKEWGNSPIGKIKTADIQAWIDGLERSPTVKRRAVEVLAGILNTAVPNCIRENPAEGVKLPAKVSTKKHRYLTHEQLWRLAEAAGEHRDHILTLGYCGIRWGELTALHVDSLDCERQVIHISHNVVKIGSKLVEGTPKTHKLRRVPVPSRVWEPLQDRAKDLAGTEVLFANRHGTYINPPTGGANARTWWNTALTKAKLPYMPIHDLRHTAASLAVKSGAHVKIVQRMLGHASAAITLDTYADLFEDDLETLIERLDSDIEAAIVVKSVVTKPAETK